jgi:hypothetical protein
MILYFIGLKLVKYSVFEIVAGKKAIVSSAIAWKAQVGPGILHLSGFSGSQSRFFFGIGTI